MMKMSRIGLISVFLLALFSGACERAGQPDPPFAFTGVSLVTLDDTTILAGQTVLISQGSIVQIGATGSVMLPSNTKVIDGRGKYLMPGLIDVHVHIEEDWELPLYLANGVTAILNMKGRPYHLELRERLRQRQIEGPDLFTTGPYIRDISPNDDAIAMMAEQYSAGYDFAKIKGDWTAEDYTDFMQAAADVGMPVVGHAPRNLPFSAVLENGRQRIAHIEEIIYTDPILNAYIKMWRPQLEDISTADQWEDIDHRAGELGKQIAKRGLAVTPNLIVMRNYALKTKPDLVRAYLDRSPIQYLNPIDRQRRRAATQKSGKIRYPNQHRMQQRLYKALNAEGVLLPVGTDSGTGGTLLVMPGFSIHEEMALLIEAGGSALQVLQQATRHGARFLDVEDRLGRLAVGYDASLLLLNANPLDNLATTAGPAGVMVRGRWYPASDLAGQLEDLEASWAGLNREVMKLAAVLQAEGPLAMVQAFSAEAVATPDLASYVESAGNGAGYELLSINQIDAAVAVFKAIVETFPASANARDSYAGSLLASGDTIAAVTWYRKALEIDPSFENAKRALARLRQ